MRMTSFAKPKGWRKMAMSTALALVVFLQPLRGQEGGPSSQGGGMTLQECVSMAMEQNPIIRSAQQQYQAFPPQNRQRVNML